MMTFGFIACFIFYAKWVRQVSNIILQRPSKLARLLHDSQENSCCGQDIKIRSGLENF